MSRAAFTKREVERAISGARAAGLTVGAVEIDRSGRIRILPAAPPPTDGDDLDDELRAWRTAHGDG